MNSATPRLPSTIERTIQSRSAALSFLHLRIERRIRTVVGCVAVLVATGICHAIAAAQSPGSPAALASALPIVGDPHDARANNLVVLDSIVFLLGVSILGGVLVWWGLRIYKEK